MFLLNRKAQVVHSVLEEKGQQQISNNESASLIGAGQIASPSPDKAEVTIIKKNKEKSSSIPAEPLLPAEEREPTTASPAQNAASSGANAPGVSKKIDNTVEEDSVTITAKSKRPGPAVQQQLKNKGILLF